MEQTAGSITVQVNKCTLSYNEWGIGNDPLIFIHAFPLDKSMWSHQAEALSAQQRVITIDMRGFGYSAAGTEEFSISLFADDIIGFMDLLEIPQAVLCGLSMGGYIALNAVQRYEKRIAGLILCDTQCNADTPEAKEGRHKSIEQIRMNGLETFADNLVKKLVSSETYTNDAALVSKLKKKMTSQDPDVVCNTLSALANRWETCTALRNVSTPTLILCGSDDAITPVEKSHQMQGLIKNSDFKIINNAGHLSNLEQPGLFNQYVDEFLVSIKK